MKRVLTAVVLIPLVLLVVLKAPNWLFSLTVGAFALVAADEYLSIVGHYGFKPLKILTLMSIALLFIAYVAGFVLAGRIGAHANYAFLGPLGEVVRLIIFFSPVLLLAAAMRRSDFSKALPEAASSALAIPYIGLSLGCLIAIRVTDGGILLLLYLFAVVWAGDVFAYYVGRAFGTHKLAPRISPGKTWEGAVASLIGSVLVGCVVLGFSDRISGALSAWNFLYQGAVPYLPEDAALMSSAVVLSIVVNIAAQLGDLLESMLKRGANVKDSGTLLPGHGGMLDRIDALLLASPVVYFYAMITNSHHFYQPVLLP